MMFKNIYYSILILFFVGCTGTTYEVDRADTASINRAVNEISSNRARVPNDTDPEYASLKLAEIYEEIEPSASFICRYLEERAKSSCNNWDVTLVDDPTLNAGAGGNRYIEINKGVFDRAESDEEIALVLAHELGHHMLNHIYEDERNQRTGFLVGLLLSAAIAYNETKDISCRRTYVRVGNTIYPPNCDQVRQEIDRIQMDTMRIGSSIGQSIPNWRFSRSQETEADLIAAYILSNSDISLFRARPIVVELARNDQTRQENSSFLDSHPSGPERLAQFDQIIQEVLTNVNRVPQN